MELDLLPLERRPDLFATGEPFAALDFELRLGMADTHKRSFEDCVRGAAQAAGGQLLFEMPDRMVSGDIVRIAAVALPGPEHDVLLFVGLDQSRHRMRLMGREEVGARFHEFASVYLEALDRLRTQFTPAAIDLSQPRVRVLGTDAVRSARS